MNREILFRGFHKDENGKETIYLDGEEIKGKWVYGYLVEYSYNDTVYINGTSPKTSYIFPMDERSQLKFLEKRIEVIPETVGQYTELSDKNGKKIFKNDIIRLDDEYRKKISAYNAKTEEDLCRRDCLVGFKEGAFMFGRNKLQLDYLNSYLWIVNQYCEVIGAIFDKKEVEE